VCRDGESAGAWDDSWTLMAPEKRLPVQTLFEYLEGGDTIDDFLDGFPTVTRAQVVVLLETAKGRVLAEAK